MQGLTEFSPGALVLLKVCPHGQPGLVTGHARGKVIVRWEDLDLIGRHAPAVLLPVGRASDQPASPNPAPFE